MGALIGNGNIRAALVGLCISATLQAYFTKRKKGFLDFSTKFVGALELLQKKCVLNKSFKP